MGTMRSTCLWTVSMSPSLQSLISGGTLKQLPAMRPNLNKSVLIQLSGYSTAWLGHSRHGSKMGKLLANKWIIVDCWFFYQGETSTRTSTSGIPTEKVRPWLAASRTSISLGRRLKSPAGGSLNAEVGWGSFLVHLTHCVVTSKPLLAKAAQQGIQCLTFTS